jgi:short-subunit dehydrogenase involved in D-alanine esterification of teichoic acids
MPFQHKKVIVLGATSGIGWALAERMVQEGVSVIAVGRRQERLDEFVKQHGGNGKVTVDTAVFDITKLDQIPSFAKDIFTKHPDLDCVFLNSGLQRHLDWTKPEEVSLETMDMEFLTNYTAFMHLTKAFLPYLQKQAPKPTSLIYTTSGLALIPIIYCPNYCASKAALHHMILAMREQLKAANSNVQVIELFPPAVQTELHDDKHQPEFKGRGSQMGMPLKEFTDEAWEGLCKEGEEGEQIPVQAVKSFMGFEGWEMERQRTMHKMMETIRKQHQQTARMSGYD